MGLGGSIDRARLVQRFDVTNGSPFPLLVPPFSAVMFLRIHHMNALILFLPLILLLTWARLVRPGFNRLEGDHIAVVSIPLLARIRMHAVPSALAIAVAFMLAVLDLVPWWVLTIPVGSSTVLILLPVAYTLTTRGIRFGWTEFRRWTEFAGVRRAPGGARLIGVQRGRGMHIWLSRSRGDDEFLYFLKQTIRGAYKGDATVIPFPDIHGAHSSASESDHLSTEISAYMSTGDNASRENLDRDGAMR